MPPFGLSCVQKLCPFVMLLWVQLWSWTGWPSGCRKCIYLKPKLQKLFQEEFPGVPLVFIDVNAVPGTLVTGNGIRVSVTSFVLPIVKPEMSTVASRG